MQFIECYIRFVFMCYKFARICDLLVLYFALRFFLFLPPTLLLSSPSPFFSPYPSLLPARSLLIRVACANNVSFSMCGWPYFNCVTIWLFSFIDQFGRLTFQHIATLNPVKFLLSPLLLLLLFILRLHFSSLSPAFLARRASYSYFYANVQ